MPLSRSKYYSLPLLAKLTTRPQPGPGEPGCVIFQYSWDILDRWPKLEYLPRPEPPPTKGLAHRHWLREYSHWKDLRCKRQRGAYFCRRHGKWITCEEIEANLASPQKHERDRDHIHQCPSSHYEWEELEEGFLKKQREEFEVLAAENAVASGRTQPGDDPDYIAQEIGPQFDNLSISNADHQGDSYPPQQPTYDQATYDTSEYPSYPKYPIESISEQPYGSPTTNKRDSKSSTGHSTSRSFGKSSGSQSSKSHGSKSYGSKPHSSKSIRTSHSSQRPPTSSTSHQKQYASRGEHGAGDYEDYEADSLYDSGTYVPEEDQAEPQLYSNQAGPQPYSNPSYWGGGGSYQ